MLLGKSCKSEFHIKNGTLKLGTLYEYRTIENTELQDQHEGMLTFHLNFHGHVRISTYWYNTLCGGSMSFGNGDSLRFPGRTSAIFDRVDAKVISEREMVIYESRAEISREAFNSFIFCMSKIRKTNECHGMFKNCDDYWYIREGQIKKFALALGENLLTKIRHKHMEGLYILPPETDMSRLKIVAQWGEIQYLSREIHIHEKDFRTLKNFTDKILNMAFTKPDDYKKEKEYRFNFIAVVDDQVVEPIVKSVILDAATLSEQTFWI